MTHELTKVAKSALVRILEEHPDGLDAMKLMSKQWLHAPIAAPTLKRFLGLLRELEAEGKAEERIVHGRGLIWFAL